MQVSLWNVGLLSACFALIFTGFQTCANIEQSVLEAFTKESNGTFTGTGYNSLAIIYTTFAIANWAAPSIVAFLGLRFAMIAGASVYTLFIASFLYPLTWLLYLGSALLGVAAATLWTAQGTYLTENSNDLVMSRNSGIFWAVFQLSLFVGNLYVFLAFRGQIEISAELRWKMFIALTSVSALGTLLLVGLRKATRPGAPSYSALISSETRQSDAGHNAPASTNDLNSDVTINTAQQPPDNSPLTSLKLALRLSITSDMIHLLIVFAYTGFALTFWSGVYGTSLRNTEWFGDHAASMLGLHGVFVGLGEVFGGLLFGIVGTLSNRYGRDPIVLLGFMVHLIAYYGAFVQLAPDAPLPPISTDPTSAAHFSYMKPSEALLLIGSFLLGFGDAAWNTQIYSLIGYVYSEMSAPAFAMYKFAQSITAAAAFFYSDAGLLLPYQLLILVVFLCLALFAFCRVEWRAVAAKQQYSLLRAQLSNS